MLDAILFDLDGTLLPMDYDVFTKGYLDLLSDAVSPYGYKKEQLLGAMWKGVGAMVKNNGAETNKDVFWRVFFGLLGEDSYNDIPKFDEFYTKGFHGAKVFTQPNGRAKELLEAARAKAKKVVLATNPFFPRVAVQARLEWCGLSDVDFAENGAAVIRKKYEEIPDDRAARQKLMAAMMRLGYDSGEIREAMRRILRDS
jgi:FMN phosphatase YigB (HAD superfamily)